MRQGSARRGKWTGFAAGLALVALSGCSETPTVPSRSELEILVVSGDGQFGVEGVSLPEPLRVVVRTRVGAVPQAGVAVDWGIVAGTGATLEAPVTVTGDDGHATNRLTLGSDPGDYRVRASFSGLVGDPAVFSARVVFRPVILGLPGSVSSAGSPVLIRGSHFSETKTDNVVLFSRVRSLVFTATSTELLVAVPLCLPTRTVDVQVSVRGVTGNTETMEVESAPPLVLGPGGFVHVPESGAPSCVRVPRAAGARYLAIAQSASTVGGGTAGFELVTLGGTGASASGPLSGAPGDGPLAEIAGEAGDAQTTWDLGVRRLEAALELPSPAARRAPGPPGPAAVPAVGDRRTFNVLNSTNGFDRVTPQVRYVGDQAIVYEDLTAPAGGLTLQDFAALAGEFDQLAFPEVTRVFGGVSDLDENERVVILMTPTVNRLTPPATQSGFVGGFFFGLDLLPNQSRSNGGEIFYTLDADPSGQFGNVQTRQRILDVLPAILAHELHHMVHFNQRVLLLGAPGTEALWLSEALAQMAETIVAEALERRGNPTGALRYHSGTFTRAGRYLGATGSTSLVIASGSGTLEERGAGWLFARYLRAQRGNDDVLGELTRTTRTGVANVEAVVGRGWADLLSDWFAALYLDGLPLPVPVRLTYPDLDLRTALGRVSPGYTLQPGDLGARDSRTTGFLASSSARYFTVSPSLAGGLAVNLAGADGGPGGPGVALRLTVVRVN